MANELPEKKTVLPPVSPEVASPSPSKAFTPLTVFLIILIALSLGIIVFFNSIIELPVVKNLLMGNAAKKQTAMETQQPTPRPTPTPIVLKPDEGTKGNYTISSSDDSPGPKISKVTFDPLDVQQDQNLTITVTISSESIPSSLTGKLTSDSKTTSLTFRNVSKSGVSSVWTTTVLVTDTLWYTYILELTATNAQGTGTITVAPRS